MTFKQAIQSGFANYVNLSGRSTRSAFWFWQLFIWIAGLVFSVFDSALFGTSFLDTGILGAVFMLATFLPGFAVAIRRLHDTDRSGWWLLLVLLPLIGILVLIYFWVQPTQARDNRFGPVPLDYIGATDSGGENDAGY
jgi:uncharacterized membrane protein YhaH (DUF805 family)